MSHDLQARMEDFVAQRAADQAEALLVEHLDARLEGLVAARVEQAIRKRVALPEPIPEPAQDPPQAGDGPKGCALRPAQDPPEAGRGPEGRAWRPAQDPPEAGRGPEGRAWRPAQDPPEAGRGPEVRSWRPAQDPPEAGDRTGQPALGKGGRRASSVPPPQSKSGPWVTHAEQVTAKAKAKVASEYVLRSRKIAPSAPVPAPSASAGPSQAPMATIPEWLEQGEIDETEEMDTAE
ncbi:hypothetical protein FOMPIDRAFT_94001 [Fomitopsis schrenkii]|uniref:Uncharacterized protein n=1 Tax=Fomitopsis schrenkii TaxID=2126942 RepID=S8DNE1_FOMSC|nr:hypothetical protein FOMPIDRAFT_94001 [Fomitopsis schrenkii]